MSAATSGTLENRDTHSPRRAGSRSLRRDLVANALVLLIAAATIFPRHRGPIDFRWDAAVYYILGTSLAQGQGYRLLNEPGNIEANQYPPLLPAFVALHQKALGTNDPVVVGTRLKRSMLAVYAALLTAAYWTLRLWLPLGWSLGAAILLVLEGQLSFMAGLCFTEVPFALAATLFIYFGSQPARPFFGALAGGCAVIAYLFRTMGIAALVAWVGDSVLKRNGRQAILRAGLAAAPILAWNLHVNRVESSREYARPAYVYQRADYLFYNVSYARNLSLLDPFRPELGRASAGDLLGRAVRNGLASVVRIGESISSGAAWWQQSFSRIARRVGAPGAPGWAGYLPVFVTGSICVFGIALLIRRKHTLPALYVLATLAAVSITPWLAQTNRYTAPVLPFLLLAFLMGLLSLQHAAARRGPLLWRRAAALLPVLFVTAIGVHQAFIFFRFSHLNRAAYETREGEHVEQWLLWYDHVDREMSEASSWLVRNAQPSAVVASSMPHWVHLRTELKTVMPPFELDGAKAQRLLDSVPVTYLFLDAPKSGVDFTRPYVAALLEQNPGRWKLAYAGRRDRVRIYERMGSSREAHAGPD